MAISLKNYYSTENPYAGSEMVATPIDIAAPVNAANQRLAAAGMQLGQELAERALKIQHQNEKALANADLVKFKTQGMDRLSQALNTYGEQAIATESKEGIKDVFIKQRTKDIETSLGNIKVSETIKSALRDAMYSAMIGEAHQVAAHEIAQGRVVRENSLDGNLVLAKQEIRNNPNDDELFNSLAAGHAEMIDELTPGDVERQSKDVAGMIKERINGLLVVDPDKAESFLESQKLLAGKEYEAERKKVTFAQIDRDALINPGIALDRLGSLNADGTAKYYKTLTPQERVTAISSVIAQVQARNHLDASIAKKRDDNISYSYYDIINRGVDPLNPGQEIPISQRGLVATAYLQDQVAKRLISNQMYEHLMKSAKEGVTTDFQSYQELRIAVATGRASVAQILSAGGIGSQDKAELLDKKRVIDNANEQLGIMKRNELTTVRQQAQHMMLPTGIQPSQEQVNTFLKFNYDLNDAVKKGADPTQFFFENGWSYMRSSVPATVFGTPQTLEDAVRIGNKIVEAYRNKTITEQAYNIEAAKIQQAKRVIMARDAQKKMNEDKEKRKVQK